MIGTKLGHYEILAKIGEGGMGEVYRARDLTLGREVAIKVLPEHRLDSPDAAQRFEREAKAVAALSHPNILSLYEFGEHEGKTFAVTELLEGESLYDRLRSGSMPLRRTIEVAGQVADGLAAAHERGIVHRDLKPANLFLTRDGRVKILDFGLAKAQPIPQFDSQAATMRDNTAPGTVLGTARYMSPEQVRGAEADARSDIFSFGTVLWEMLSGRVAFERDSAVEIMSAILKEDPPELSAINESVPLAIDRIVRRCLEKAPERRFQSAHDLSFALRNALDSSSRGLPALEAAPAEQRGHLRTAAIAAFCLLLGAVGGFWASSRLRAPQYPEPVKVTPLTQSGADWSPDASPDGKTIAFVSARDGRPRIWLRQMAGGIEVPLTQGIDIEPSFAPDGSSVLFLRDEGTTYSAYRVPVIGGSERKVLDNVTEATWSPDGKQLAYLRVSGEAVAPVMTVGILEVQSGAVRELRKFEARLVRGLRWSPDGKWMLLVLGSVVQNAANEILIVDVESGETRWNRIQERQYSAPAWTPDSRSFLIAQSNTVLGDISSTSGRVLRVDPFADRERTEFWVQSVFAGAADFVRFDFIDANRMVFDEIIWQGTLTLAQYSPLGVGLDGREMTTGNSRDRQPTYSRDGRSVLFSSNRSGNADLWLLSLGSGEVRQLTDDPADDWDPAFSSDGRSIIWSSNRSGHLEIWIANVDGTGARQLSQDGVDAENPTQTPDGKWILYGSGNLERNGIWRMRSDGSEAARVIPGAYFLPEVAPDGVHVAYLLNDGEHQRVVLSVAEIESGQVVFETDVEFSGFQNLIQPGRPRWTPDGTSLLFMHPNDQGYFAIFEQAFRPGTDTKATRRLCVTATGNTQIESFGVAPDGKTIVFAALSQFRSLKLAEWAAQ